MTATTQARCELCHQDGGTVLYRTDAWRVVRVDDPHYPGFCRVILNRHEREMTALSAAEQIELMAAVFTVESVVRRIFQPDKINLASFGNMAPHVHWHIIPRWQDDRHFPEPIWGAVHREGAPQQRIIVSDDQLATAIATAFRPAVKE
ncbi:HIT family protein [Dechloromonas sp.]|uniref:HIT family protein n=1 Tax=Dechloromonas sp. TaxID=1917218 RepID=UPI00263F8B90|nr:HIT family protein [Dechloromonas sp.]